MNFIRKIRLDSLTPLIMHILCILGVVSTETTCSETVNCIILPILDQFVQNLLTEGREDR